MTVAPAEPPGPARRAGQPGLPADARDGQLEAVIERRHRQQVVAGEEPVPPTTSSSVPRWNDSSVPVDISGLLNNHLGRIPLISPHDPRRPIRLPLRAARGDL